MSDHADFSRSRAFVACFELPPSGSGPLEGLSFAVKDLIDVAGWTTGCGNPSWRDSHPPAAVHAVCVEQLLALGARCVGKTVCDELAFSLLGQNHFEGTPLNPRAPDRVPGSSSSGSASAVACGLVDFALGTDTGGSVRVPASNCLGLRLSHGFISLGGVNPLAPSFDTVGLFAARFPVLKRVAAGLLASEPVTAAEPATISSEPFSAAAERRAASPASSRLRLAPWMCHRSRVSCSRICRVCTDEAGLNRNDPARFTKSDSRYFHKPKMVFGPRHCRCACASGSRTLLGTRSRWPRLCPRETHAGPAADAATNIY